MSATQLAPSTLRVNVEALVDSLAELTYISDVLWHLQQESDEGPISKNIRLIQGAVLGALPDDEWRRLEYEIQNRADERVILFHKASLERTEEYLAKEREERVCV